MEGLEENLIESNGGSDCEDMSKSCKSSTTAVVVLSTLVAACGSFGYGCAVGYSSPAGSGIRQDLGLSLSAYSVFGSIVTVGGMMGAILSGKIADIFGRKSAMWLSEIFCIIGWIAIAFTKDSLWLDLGRLSIGFGIGIITYVVPVYIAEIAPKDLRGVFASINQLMLTCGFSLLYLIGNIFSWHTLALVGAIPCLLQFIGLFFIPESPRWLIRMDREHEFKNALQRLRGWHADILEKAAETRYHIEISQRNSDGGITELFQRKHVNSLIIGVGLMLLQQLGGCNALSYYATIIFEKADISISIGSTIIAIVQIPTTVLVVLLMDRAGRRALLLISATGLCFFFFLMGSAFFLQVQAVEFMKKFTPTLVLIGLVGSCISYSIGMAGVPWIIMSEIFPITLKTSAGSLVTFVFWSCSWIVTYTFNFMLEWSPGGTFFIFTGVYVVSVWFIAKIVPETKGKTLEEIQASIISTATFLK